MFTTLRAAIKAMFKRPYVEPVIHPLADDNTLIRNPKYNTRIHKTKLSVASVKVDQPHLIELLQCKDLLTINKHPDIKKLTDNRCIVCLKVMDESEKGELFLKVYVVGEKLNAVRNACKGFSFKGTPKERFEKELIMYLFLNSNRFLKSSIIANTSENRYQFQNYLINYNGNVSVLLAKVIALKLDISVNYLL